MSIEKMRDTYEAWASSVLLQGKVTQEFIKGMREVDTYSLTGYSAETSRKYLVGVISAGWMSWQESRAAIEVELPEQRNAPDRDCWARTNALGYNTANHECRTSIESLGLKVKG